MRITGMVLPADGRASGYDSLTGQRLGADVAFDAGPGLVLVMGYGRKAGVRGELEVGYRTFAIDRLSDVRVDNVAVPGSVDVGGDVTSFSVMGNIVSSLDLGLVNFYVGGGIGIARVETELRSFRAGSHSISVWRSDREDAFAWQLFAGLQYHLSEDFSAALGYRYFTTEDARLRRSGVTAGSRNLELSLTHWLN